MFQEILQQVLDLQPYYSHANDLEMRERGALIRRALPQALTMITPSIATALGVDAERIIIKGSDGVGQKSQYCWTRFASYDHSPDPRTGWYAVFLFHAEGSSVCLSLNQGTTTWDGGSFTPQDPVALQKRVAWAREVLGGSVTSSRLTQTLDLGGSDKNGLGRSYAYGHVAGFHYTSGEIPRDQIVEQDIVEIAKLLGELYRAQDLGRQPGGLSPEEVMVLEAARPRQSSNSRGTGQGRGLSLAERRAVELHAMKRATEFLQSEGYVVEDTSATRPFDLKASRASEIIFVEVKGTTSFGQSIILTSGEVTLQRSSYPNNALILVHSIELSRNHTPPIATGGKLHIDRPWLITDDILSPVTFNCRIGRE